ncbi:hypothetical protein PG993_007622 [Apiospora rasikravindrae]|uniref:Uncharacterized protein n=1 Tax=Apiospora rasikravindrae TaxID=990691 RepID=A0ABR1SY03_9PEZI
MDVRGEGRWAAAPSQPSQGPAILAQELVSKQDQRLHDAKRASMGRLFGWRGVRSKGTFLGGEGPAQGLLSALPVIGAAPRQVAKMEEMRRPWACLGVHCGSSQPGIAASGWRRRSDVTETSRVVFWHPC